MPIKHAFASPIADAGDADLVGPNEWNEDHQPLGSVVARIETDQTCSSTGFSDLGTVGPTVTVTVNTKALVTVSAFMYALTDRYGSMTWIASGANTIAADFKHALADGPVGYESAGSRSTMLTGLTPGSTTFTAKYRSLTGDSINFANREISVICLD